MGALTRRHLTSFKLGVWAAACLGIAAVPPESYLAALAQVTRALIMKSRPLESVTGVPAQQGSHERCPCKAPRSHNTSAAKRLRPGGEPTRLRASGWTGGA